MIDQPPTADGSPAAEGPETSSESEPLSWPERVGAWALGLVAGGGGGWAVFATDNQAGSAVLVIIGAAFLLMGLQGTPLIRLGSAETGVELDRRRSRVNRAIEQARHEENAEVAAGIVEGASIIEPDLFQSPHFRGELYTSRVAVALQSAGFTISRNSRDHGPDLLVGTGTSMAVVEVKYLQRSRLGIKDIRQAEGFTLGGAQGAVLVTNTQLTTALKEYNADDNNKLVQAVTWNDDRDTPFLVQALMRVMAGASNRPVDQDGERQS